MFRNLRCRIDRLVFRLRGIPYVHLGTVTIDAVPGLSLCDSCVALCYTDDAETLCDPCQRNFDVSVAAWLNGLPEGTVIMFCDN